MGKAKIVLSIIIINLILFGCSQKFNENNNISNNEKDSNATIIETTKNQSFMTLTPIEQSNKREPTSVVTTNNKTDSHKETVKNDFELTNNINGIMDYLNRNVPEIAEFREQIEKNSEGKISVIMRVDDVPDNNSKSEYKDFYDIYVGENHPNHTVRWNSFYVHKDLNKILVSDIVTGEVITLEKWRDLKKKRGF